MNRLSIIFSYIFVILFATSCSNFRPLYGDDRISLALSEIEIEEVETLQNTELYYQLTKLFGAPHNTKYLLRLSAENHVSPLVISSKAHVVAQNVEQVCTYMLIDKSTDKILTSGKIRMIGSYGSLSTPYASYTKEQHTQHNLGQSVAEDLRLRLMMYFAKHS